MGILPISTILTMCSAISMDACFTFFPGNEFGFLHDAFEEFVVQDWKGLSLERAARPIHRIPARRFYVNPKQEIELVLRVLSTQPTDEDIFHLEHEDVNPRKVEQEPEEEPEEAPEERPEEEPEEEPVPLPVPVGGTGHLGRHGQCHSKSSELMKQRVRLADQPTLRTWGCRSISAGSWKS